MALFPMPSDFQDPIGKVAPTSSPICNCCKLNWLVQDRIQDGRLNGVMLGNGSHVCLEMFADDTNAVVENEERSITCFWECLQI